MLKIPANIKLQAQSFIDRNIMKNINETPKFEKTIEDISNATDATKEQKAKLYTYLYTAYAIYKGLKENKCNPILSYLIVFQFIMYAHLFLIAGITISKETLNSYVSNIIKHPILSLVKYYLGTIIIKIIPGIMTYAMSGGNLIRTAMTFDVYEKLLFIVCVYITIVKIICATNKDVTTEDYIYDDNYQLVSI